MRGILQDKGKRLQKALDELRHPVDGWPPVAVRPPRSAMVGEYRLDRYLHLQGPRSWCQAEVISERLDPATPREVCELVRQIDALIEWAEARREGQIRHQREVERQQAHYVAQLEAAAPRSADADSYERYYKALRDRCQRLHAILEGGGERTPPGGEVGGYALVYDEDWGWECQCAYPLEDTCRVDGLAFKLHNRAHLTTPRALALAIRQVEEWLRWAEEVTE